MSGNMGYVLALPWKEMQTEQGASNGEQDWRQGGKPEWLEWCSKSKMNKLLNQEKSVVCK